MSALKGPARLPGLVRNIFVGWMRKFKILKTSDSIAELSRKRLAHCAVCEHAQYSKIIELINGNLEEVDTKICGLCHCPCVEKSLVLEEKCDDGKW